MIESEKDVKHQINEEIKKWMESDRFNITNDGTPYTAFYAPLNKKKCYVTLECFSESSYNPDL